MLLGRVNAASMVPLPWGQLFDNRQESAAAADARAGKRTRKAKSDAEAALKSKSEMALQHPPIVLLSNCENQNSVVHFKVSKGSLRFVASAIAFLGSPLPFCCV